MVSSYLNNATKQYVFHSMEIVDNQYNIWPKQLKL